MYRLIPYGLLLGVIFISIGGFLTVTSTSFSSAASFVLDNRYKVILLLIVGISMYILSYLISLSGTSFNDPYEEGDADYRKRKALNAFVDICKRKLRWFPYLIVAVFLYLVFKTSISFNVIQAGLIIMAIFVAFVWVMQYRGAPADEDEGWDHLDRLKFFRMTDYRKHPISLSLVLFTIIVMYYAWVNPYGVMEDYQMIDTTRYSSSLPEYTRFLIIVIFLDMFIYISHNYNFFGLRKMHVSRDVLLGVQFAEMIICGVCCLLWILSVVTFMNAS